MFFLERGVKRVGKNENKLRIKELDEKLTERQERFIDYWIKLGDAKNAAIEAGYSKKTAAEIGRQNLIILDKFIRLHGEKPKSERVASADEVLEFLTAGMRGEITDEIVSFWDGITQRATVMPPLRDRKGCAELLGKRYKMFTDKVEQSIDTEIVVRMEGLEDLSK